LVGCPAFTRLLNLKLSFASDPDLQCLALQALVHADSTWAIDLDAVLRLALEGSTVSIQAVTLNALQNFMDDADARAQRRVQRQAIGGVRTGEPFGERGAGRDLRARAREAAANDRGRPHSRRWRLHPGTFGRIRQGS
jgi:hypothetical protein